MPMSDLPRCDLPAWRALEAHRARWAGVHLRELLAADPERGRRMVRTAADLYYDFAKAQLTDETLGLLLHLAEEVELPARIAELFAGRRVNVTENRPALHMALRAPPQARFEVDGVDVVPQVHAVLNRMAAFAQQLRSGAWRGHTGQPIRHVVNLGIGGSDLGPAMACEALRAYHDSELTFRFVSNVDGTDLAEATRDLDPAQTLFIVASKTFTTLETLTNARAARAWCLAALKEERAIARHFVAVSTNAAEVARFGIDPANMFEFWDWVGGRYSLPSAIGLPVMCAIGPQRFFELLGGFHAIDEHFRTAPLEQNLPVVHALVTLWHTTFLGYESVAILPYDQYLRRLPAYLQQLTMESNGKSVTRDGRPVAWPTGPVYWGEPGTNSQHSFFQLLHQGTRRVLCEFLACLQPLHRLPQHHDLLIANLLAQAEALAWGKTAEEVQAEGVPATLVPHRTFPGNRPSTVLLLPRLAPATLGQLIALYEHSVYVQAVLWDINPFDQWGVELGKVLAGRIAAELQSPAPAAGGHDSSTHALIEYYRRHRRADA